MEADNSNSFYGTMQGVDTISMNQPYNNSLQLRLDCNQILSDIQDFLSGTVTYNDWDNETQRERKLSRQVGEPLANALGIQAIMFRCRSIFNPQTVQGNYNDERYNLYIKFLRQELAMKVSLNRYKWDVKQENQNVIVDTIMNFAKPFMSRTLYNKERESYMSTMQSKETHTIQPTQEKKGWGL